MGVPYNEAHEKRLLDLLQRMFVALVVDDKVGADKELIVKIKCYLNRAVEKARHMLPIKTGFASGDSFTGGDDSDKEEEPNAKRRRIT